MTAPTGKFQIQSFTCNGCGAEMKEADAVWLDCPGCPWSHAYCEGCAEEMADGFLCNDCSARRERELQPIFDASELGD